MTFVEVVALMAAVGVLASSLANLIQLFRVQKVVEANNEQVVVLKHEVNSRLTEMLALARDLGHATGVAEGVKREAEATRQDTDAGKGAHG